MVKRHEDCAIGSRAMVEMDGETKKVREGRESREGEE